MDIVHILANGRSPDSAVSYLWSSNGMAYGAGRGSRKSGSLGVGLPACRFLLATGHPGTFKVGAGCFNRGGAICLNK